MVRDGYSRGFRDSPPDVTDTGIGKNYNGHRLFHSRRTCVIEYILYDGSRRAPDPPDVETFKRDLTEAARNGDVKVRRYLREYRNLMAKENGAGLEQFKAEPENINDGGAVPISGTRTRSEATPGELSDKPRLSTG